MVIMVIMVLLAICLVLNQLNTAETRSINHDEFGVEQDQLGDLANLAQGNNCFCLSLFNCSNRERISQTGVITMHTK